MSLPMPARLAIGSVIACVLLYFFPLVRVRKFEQAETGAAAGIRTDASASPTAAATDVATYAESLWSDQLPAAAEQAALVDDVLQLAAANPAQARREYGRQVGLGGPTFLFLRGHGRVERVDDDECWLVITDREQRVSLQIGILFGNALRDATGLVDVEAFANSQDFNNLSTDLNRRCEAMLRQHRELLVVGAQVAFTGCSEVRSDHDFSPLAVIPVQLQVVPAETTE